MDTDHIENAGIVRALAEEGMSVEKISFMMRMSIELIESILSNVQGVDEKQADATIKATK